MSNPKPWPFLIKSILRSSFENRLKIDVRIVYGKNELQPEEINWLQKLAYIRTNFCKNLHAKCYINEETCIITSLNLYEFSQINNNNEMGVFLSRGDDIDLYKEAYEEAQRIIQISDEMIHISLEKASKEPMVSKITRKPRTVVSSLPQN
jgi:thymidine kinase